MSDPVQATPQPAPLKRKPGNPGKVATHAEIADRIDAGISMLNKGFRSNTIVRKLCETYGINRRMAAIYIAHSREAMLREIEKPREQLVSEAYHRFLGVVRTPGVDPSVVIQAQKAICELLGLEAPKRVEHDVRTVRVIEVFHANELGNRNGNGTSNGNGHSLEGTNRVADLAPGPVLDTPDASTV